ncbi:helix-turn-helix transcriptional regulator [Stackebrandtia albiflava]
MQATRPHQVQGLCDLYGVPPAQRAELERWAKEGAKRGWWEQYREGVPPETRAFVEAEAEMATLQSLELEHIPGLLQTDDYLQAVQAALLPMPPERVKAIRWLRHHRQERVFARTPLPRMTMLIGRSALWYLDGLGEVGDRQRKRIIEVSQMPGADIRVITELHPAMVGAFTIITPGPPIPGPPFVFVDSVDGGRYEEKRDVVSLYERTFAAALKCTIPFEEYLK